MKILLLLFLTIFLGRGCDEDQKQDMETAIIEYSANTRGYFLKITVKEKMISITKDRNETKQVFEKISALDSNEIMASVKEINLEELANLKAPTEKRFYDGAAIGILKITYKNRIYETSGFDHGIPPVEIERLVKKLNAMVKE